MSYNKNNPRPCICIPNFQTNYSQKQDVSLSFTGSRHFTKQEFRDECDINTLMAKYQSTGEMPCINQSAPQYLDVTSIDYQECMQFVAGAQSLFNDLPSSLRNRFDNDPAKFLDFTSNPDNYSEMSKLGLLKPEHERVYTAPSLQPVTPVTAQSGVQSSSNHSTTPNIHTDVTT